MQLRRRGAVIVDTKKGILVVSGKKKKFSLPGGGAKKGESRKNAAIRELYEETNLKTKEIKFLFKYIGHKWRNHKGNSVRNYTKVFLVNPIGIPKPRNEIKRIAFWTPKSKIIISEGTRRMLESYKLGLHNS